MTSPQDSLGFPPGAAAEMTTNAFRKYQTSQQPTQRPGPGPTSEEAVAKKPPPQAPLTDFKRISTWNGGETDRYRWTQTFTTITVEFDLQEPARGKDVKVSFEPSKIEVAVKGQSLLAGALPYRLRPSDCTWSLEDGRLLLLTMEKEAEGWWVRVAEGEPEIDGKQIESCKRVEEYPEETQATIRKIMFDRDQKAKGLPTSDELEKEAMLRQAWEAEGSPFKGTPFDPSVLNMQ